METDYVEPVIQVGTEPTGQDFPVQRRIAQRDQPGRNVCVAFDPTGSRLAILDREAVCSGGPGVK